MRDQDVTAMNFRKSGSTLRKVEEEALARMAIDLLVTAVVVLRRRIQVGLA